MWASITKWYCEWDEELLAVLKQPELAEEAPPGYRRVMAQRIALMPPIERQELFDFCMRYRGPTLTWAAVKLLAGFTIAGLLLKLSILPSLSWWAAVLYANLFGYLTVVALVGVWFNHRKIVAGKYRWIIKLAAWGLAGGLSAMLIGMVVRGDTMAEVLEKLPKVLIGVTAVPTLLIGLPLVAIAMHRNQRYEDLTARLQVEAERERLARALSESQLRLLRAQIEPHFLFNTLGAVQQLAQQGAPRAAALTADLIDFLRASLSEMRSDQSCLRTEFRLAESYLKVMQARLGSRLRFSVELPASLAEVSIPSMLVLTLAENAIKHGIEPALRGGEVVLTAEDAGQAIHIRVRDSGVGMSDTPGAGLGLENIRHRLRLAYGEAASLALEEAEPGLAATITIPKTTSAKEGRA